MGVIEPPKREAAAPRPRCGRALASCALVSALFLAACTDPPPPTIRISSAPEEGATLSINGEPYGNTPRVIDNLASGGPYFAILEMYGYERETQQFMVPDEGDAEITIEMTPLVGYLTVDTEPSGSQLYLDDDTALGTTPLADVPIRIGNHTLTFQRSDHKSLDAEIVIEAHRRYVKLYPLEKLDAFIEIYSRPSFSTILINDKPRAEATPARIMLPPGVYTIGVSQNGYITKEVQIELGAGAEEVVEFDLPPGDAPPGMVLIPAGEFVFGVQDGAPDEAPKAVVNLPAFYIDKFEVTNRDYARVFPNHRYEDAMADAPVTGVNYRQAAEYARLVGKRLPTEREWEKAARGPAGLAYPWGNAFLPENVNMTHANTTRKAAPAKVGSYRTGASPYGVMDMAGNAYEWVQDWYGPYPGNTVISTEYGQVFRVLRGGSYLNDDPFDVRAAARHYDRPENARADYGFRCAVDVGQTLAQ